MTANVDVNGTLRDYYCLWRLLLSKLYVCLVRSVLITYNILPCWNLGSNRRGFCSTGVHRGRDPCVEGGNGVECCRVSKASIIMYMFYATIFLMKLTEVIVIIFYIKIAGTLHKPKGPWRHNWSPSEGPVDYIVGRTIQRWIINI